jgi:hypothetical protein
MAEPPLSPHPDKDEAGWGESGLAGYQSCSSALIKALRSVREHFFNAPASMSHSISHAAVAVGVSFKSVASIVASVRSDATCAVPSLLVSALIGPHVSPAPTHQGRCRPRSGALLSRDADTPAWVVVLIPVVRRRSPVALSHDTSLDRALLLCCHGVTPRDTCVPDLSQRSAGTLA